MGLLDGRNAVVFGVANERSIAWAIARALHEHGATVGLSYASETLRRRVEPLAASIDSPFTEQCDVTSDQAIASLFEKAAAVLGSVDILVHAVAYADRDDLRGAFSDTSRAGFHTAMDISVYSLVALVHHALPRMRAGSSVLTITYYGGQKVAPNYNVMGVAKSALESSTRYLAAELGPKGIRMNAISAGPVRTLSAQAVSGFRHAQSEYEKASPMKRSIDAEDVGNAAVWLASDLARNVTGEILFVDGGYNIMAGGLHPNDEA
ncbi:MAG: enoyl-ACP reductase FabI [Spirochaetota bacterium]